MNRVYQTFVFSMLLGASLAFAAEPAKPAASVPSPWNELDLGLAAWVQPTTQPVKPAPVAAPPVHPALEKTSSPAGTRPVARASVGGSATFADGVFRVLGTMDIWGLADGCHFIWQPATDDVDLIARVVSMDNPGGVAHAKASLCIRDSLEAGARHITLALTATDGVQLLQRPETDGKTERIAVDVETEKKLLPKAQFPCWLRLTRVGTDVTALESSDGVAWQKVGAVAMKFAGKTYVGLAASSHKPDVLMTATFDHVSIRLGTAKPAPATTRAVGEHR